MKKLFLTEDDTSTDEESEDEIEVKEGQNGKEIIIKHDPSEKAMIIKEGTYRSGKHRIHKPVIRTRNK